MEPKLNSRRKLTLCTFYCIERQQAIRKRQIVVNAEQVPPLSMMPASFDVEQLTKVKGVLYEFRLAWQKFMRCRRILSRPAIAMCVVLFRRCPGRCAVGPPATICIDCPPACG